MSEETKQLPECKPFEFTIEDVGLQFLIQMGPKEGNALGLATIMDLGGAAMVNFHRL